MKRFKTLEKIDMKNNKVNNIEELDSFIKYLPNLKELNLIDNSIKYNLLIKIIIELAKEKKITISINPQ